MKKTAYQTIDSNGTITNVSPNGFYEVVTQAGASQRRRAMYSKNALKAKYFGGKRFLGFTPSGAEFWVSFNLDLETLEFTMSKTHSFNELLKDGAELATVMVSIPRHKASNNIDIDRMVSQNQKNAGGEMTPSRVKYFDRMFNLYESQNPRAYVKGIPTKTFFIKVASSICAGDINSDDTAFTMYEVIKNYDLPNGEYFNI